MKLVPPREAVDQIGASRRIVASPGCGAPSTLLAEIGHDAERIVGSSLYSGLLLDGYPFLESVERGTIRYGTWHVTAPVRGLVARGGVDFFPVRGSRVPALLRHLGVDTALVRVSPPDERGYCSLGPSVSYPKGAVALAELVVAEIDDAVPRTRGDSLIHVSEIDIACESELPMPEYPRAAVDDVSREIARHIVPLLPPSPVIQIGIGSVPEALVDEFRAAGLANLRFAGMGVDGMADLFEAGCLAPTGSGPYPPVVAGELMGTNELMRFADDNSAVGVYPTGVAISAATLGAVPRFVSINSAVEVDRQGQVNSEWAGGKQLSSVGGGADFVDAALQSEGGMSIIAITSANVRDASSKIVPAFSTDAPVTIPRHSVDYVVTELGAARVGFSSLRERTEALAAIARPEHRETILAGAGGV